MNKNDSERIAAFLDSLKMEAVGEPEEADLLIINSCSVRQASEDRVYGIIHNWQKFREAKPNLIIAVTGCMAGRDLDGKIKGRLGGVDLLFKIDDLHILPKWLGELGDSDKIDYLEISPARQNKSQAFITIQSGCDNYCTYCVVPFARGREKNRSVKSIMREIKDAATAGCKELTLLGQVVNHYIAPDPENFSSDNPFCNLSRKQESASEVIHSASPFGTTGPKDDFAALLWETNQIEGIERITWTAADPQYFSDAQIQALKLPRQMNYLHLPVQCGDNEILRKMNRHYFREKYIDLIKKIRLVRPEIAIGTDIIVGFCGETDEQFNNTVDLYRQCEFDIAYLAKYSERSGTAAAKAFKDDVPKIVKKQRWQILQDLMEELTFKKNQKYLDQEVLVLVDKCEEGVCTGNSGEMKMIQFLGAPELVGKIVKIKITQALTWMMKGVPVV